MDEGVKSAIADVTSRIPQGSVIGNTMLLFYINDLPVTTKSAVRIFADDTVAYNTSDNHTDLQEGLEKLAVWENESTIKFHLPKYQHLTSEKRTSNNQSLTLHHIEIQGSSSVKYLGVTLNPKERAHMLIILPHIYHPQHY